LKVLNGRGLKSQKLDGEIVEPRKAARKKGSEEIETKRRKGSNGKTHSEYHDPS